MTKDLDKSAPILLDCDGVLAGFNEYSTAVARSKGYNVTVDDCVGDCRNQEWWHGSGLEQDWTQPGFCEQLPVLEGSQEFVENLRKMGLRVVFLTSPPKDNPTWPHERRIWLEKNFDARRVDVIFAVDKRYVNGLTFLDDHVKNILHWQEYQNRMGVLVRRPWNEDILPDCDNYTKLCGLDDSLSQHLYHKKKEMKVWRSNNWNEILHFVELIKNKGNNPGSQTKESAS